MEREEFIRKMHSQIDIWNNEITDLGNQREHFFADVKHQYEEVSAGLSTRISKLREDLTQAEAASGEAFADLKTGLELAATSVKEALDSAKQRFRKDQN